MTTHIRTVSVSPIWDKIMQDFNISPTKALKDGIALALAVNYPEFPRNELEEALYNDSKLPAYKATLVKKMAEIYGKH